VNSIPYPLSLNYLKYRLAFFLFYPPDYTSKNGRALLEGRSFVHKPSSENYAVCPYSGTRFQHLKLMNKSALKSTANNTASIKVLLNSYGRSLRFYSQIGNMTLVELWRLSYAGWTSPLFHIYRHPTSVLIDDASADLSKFCHGILTLLHSLFENNVPASGSWTASQLYEYSEKENLLIGYNEVCAAPSALIISTLNYMIQQTDNSQWVNQDQSDPLNISNDILSFCQARWLMERACIIYESTRYITLLAFDAASTIKQRHSFPYTMFIAKHLASPSANLSKLYQYWFANKSYVSQGHVTSIENKLNSLTYLSYEIESNKDDYNLASRQWSLFEEHMLEIVQYAETIVTAPAQDANIYQYKKSDLSIFFGESAFEKNSDA